MITQELKIAYIGGGSREWARNLMGDLALEEQLAGVIKLYDLDYQAAVENQIIGNKLTARTDVKGKWSYQAVERLEEALDGADLVIISILPGTFQEMASDVHLPEEYGIYQPVGDTVGPGGLVRALRTIPMFVEIAGKIAQYSPGAWVINYTNPMSLCVRTLYEVFPKIKAFGCCHEVFGTQLLLTKALAEVKQITGVKREEIRVNVLGINHFTWINQASYQSIDLMPVFTEFADKYYETGYGEEEKKDGLPVNDGKLPERVKFDLFKRYGLIAAAGDRHLAEFLPPWYLKNPETVKQWGFHLTSVSWRIEHRKELAEKREKWIAGLEEFELKPSGEESVRQIKALFGLEELVTNVNLPNRGQITGLPSGAVVETNAFFTTDSVRPVLAGELPPDVQNLVFRHVLNQETILQAASDRNKDLAFRAFLNDPLVTISPLKARELFDRMLANTRGYLPGWKL